MAAVPTSSDCPAVAGEDRGAKGQTRRVHEAVIGHLPYQLDIPSQPADDLRARG